MKKIITFLILSILISISVNAQFCNKYADKAVSQYKLAKKNNLPNINWPVWSDDWNGHLNWCKSVSHDVANKELAKRQAYLDKYIKKNNDISINDATRAVLNDMVKNQPKYNILEQPVVTTGANSKNAICEHYAKESVRQNKVNISNNCGFKGPSWSSDYNAHKNWCMKDDNYRTADAYLKNRNQKLANCSKSTSLAMTNSGGRSALGTTMATTYMDMHNMFVPHKNNCSSSEAFVPLWQGAELGFCIDKDLHPSGAKHWSEAIRTCLSENKRLPEPWERKLACDYAIPLGIKHMIYATNSIGDWKPMQWGSNFSIMLHFQYMNTYPVFEGMVVPAFGGNGDQGGCKSGSYAKVGGLTIVDASGTLEYTRESLHFRCVH